MGLAQWTRLKRVAKSPRLLLLLPPDTALIYVAHRQPHPAGRAQRYIPQPLLPPGARKSDQSPSPALWKRGLGRGETSGCIKSVMTLEAGAEGILTLLVMPAVVNCVSPVTIRQWGRQQSGLPVGSSLRASIPCPCPLPLVENHWYLGKPWSDGDRASRPGGLCPGGRFLKSPGSI
jgi:hypothetical protein